METHKSHLKPSFNIFKKNTNLKFATRTSNSEEIVQIGLKKMFLSADIIMGCL